MDSVCDLLYEPSNAVLMPYTHYWVYIYRERERECVCVFLELPNKIVEVCQLPKPPKSLGVRASNSTSAASTGRPIFLG